MGHTIFVLTLFQKRQARQSSTPTCVTPTCVYPDLLTKFMNMLTNVSKYDDIFPALLL